LFNKGNETYSGRHLFTLVTVNMLKGIYTYIDVNNRHPLT